MYDIANKTLRVLLLIYFACCSLAGSAWHRHDHADCESRHASHYCSTHLGGGHACASHRADERSVDERHVIERRAADGHEDAEGVVVSHRCSAHRHASRFAAPHQPARADGATAGSNFVEIDGDPGVGAHDADDCAICRHLSQGLQIARPFTLESQFAAASLFAADPLSPVLREWAAFYARGPPLARA